MPQRFAGLSTPQWAHSRSWCPTAVPMGSPKPQCPNEEPRTHSAYGEPQFCSRCYRDLPPPPLPGTATERCVHEDTLTSWDTPVLLGDALMMLARGRGPAHCLGCPLGSPIARGSCIGQEIPTLLGGGGRMLLWGAYTVLSCGGGYPRSPIGLHHPLPSPLKQPDGAGRHLKRAPPPAGWGEPFSARLGTGCHDKHFLPLAPGPLPLYSPPPFSLSLLPMASRGGSVANRALQGSR